MSEYLPLYKRNVKLALPVMVSQLGHVTVSLADTMMVGHAGTTDLAAAAFSNGIFHIGMLFGMGFITGLTPLVGKEYIRNKYKETGELLKNGIFLHVVGAAVLTAIMAGVGFFLGYMGQPENVVEKALPYFMLLTASLFPLLVFYSFKQFFEGTGNTILAMNITLMANVVNIGLNYVLIFGKLGFPAMGIVGAGIATLVSRILMPVLLIPFILKSTKYREVFSFARKAPLLKSRLRKLFTVGLPIGFQMIIEMLLFAMGAVMMGWIGEVPLAAHNVAISMASATYMITGGIGAATTILVSHELGMRNYPVMRKAISASIHLVTVFMVITAAVFVLLRYQLPLLFTSDTVVVDVAASLLIVAALFQIFDGVQVILLASLRGIADVTAPMFIAFLSYSVIGLPVSYVCAFVLDMGPWGIWLGFLAGLAVAAVLFGLRLQRLVKTR